MPDKAGPIMNRFMRIFAQMLLWFLSMLILLDHGASGAVLYDPVLKDPGVPDGEQIIWRAIRDDKPTIISTITWSAKDRNGTPVYEITALGKTRQGTYVINRSDLRLTWAHFFEQTEKGKSEATIEARGDKQYLVHDFKNKRDKKERDNHPDGYNGVTLIFALRGFPFGSQKQLKLRITPGFSIGMPLWAWRMWKAYVKPLGEEQITVPAGTFDCYKLEVAASGGIIKRITSKYYFWYMKEPPYRFVKFQDKDAKNVTELIEIKSTGN